MVVGIAVDITGVLLMFKFQELLKFRESDVKKMAENAVDNHKRQIAVGKDFQNESFTKYSKSYAKKKKQGRRRPVTLRDTGKMLRAFDVQKTFLKKNSEIRFTYGIKKNKQGTKLFQHNEGIKHLPKRSIAENQELGDRVENGIVNDFVNTFNRNLSRMSKTHVKVNI